MPIFQRKPYRRAVAIKSVRVVLCTVNIYREGGRGQVLDTYTLYTQQSRSDAGDFLAAALSQCLDSDCAAVDTRGQSVVDSVDSSGQTVVDSVDTGT